MKISVGSLVLDPARKSVHRGDQPLNRTPREYGLLLLYLIRHAGDEVTRRRSSTTCGTPAFEGGDNVIEVYVGYLRRTIDAPVGMQTLSTLRGLGYRLDGDEPASERNGANVSPR